MRTEILLLLAGLWMLPVAGCVSLPAERLSDAIEKQELSERKYLKDRFASYGLVPWAGAKGYEQPFGFETNVIGVLVGCRVCAT